MNDTPQLMTGGQHVVRALLEHGVDTVFGVPGESYLDVLNALYTERERIRLVSCRHEGAASFMAEAHGKLTGRPGICMVTRGPGATNASIGVQTAFQDSTPLIVLVGQVGNDMVEREAFQEIDYRRMFGQFSKWVAQIDSAARVTEYMNRAFSVAMSGRPGPVVLALPEDMLTELAAPQDCGTIQFPQAHPAPDAMADMRALLAGARRPLMIVGGSGWSSAGLDSLARFASRNGLPVACSFRRQDLYDNHHPQYVGEVGIGVNPELAEAVRRADVILAVGARLGEMVTGGYTLLQSPVPKQTLIHVLASPEELGRVYQPTVKIPSGLDAFADAAAALDPLDAAPWRGWLDELRQSYLRYTEPPATALRMDPARVIVALREGLDARAILTNGAGNYSAWAHRYYRFSHPRTQLAPTSGAMGYGVPAAIAAKLRHPERQVVCLAGDGCFLMTSQELATAKQHRLAIVFIVFNNGMYGTIRMHQEVHYPGRTIGTDLCNPDFVAYAESFGVPAERVDSHEGFAPALARALDSGSPYLIELSLDPEVITPRATLTSLREKARLAAS
ncbi:Acetolactate synthase isozyme 2 large subunit [Achromobacter spanius]|uniref:thiamine pyrophosphate-binding protein n=1 Tax=Achromobacter spanius TaxID=217203 RepID=UPI000C2BCCA5|nr:thiamine pyrophosphate-binding protein [Achromobacter spanius]AUA56600.1 thiamine pyrophosphate-binding protein [Achromobacter spanius]CAB3644864.1 Acetolactate synthase isozyme 2 large subunit [Achromobacter spanius]SPT38995.1 Acetolactate synthase isozyme 2 large subunit [Achromobacter denitrificans]VEE55810.1 Acetolactate synthase isozyme 2 large subunit [Achromobacter spanius]